MSMIYEKGSQVHGTTVFTINSGALYVDEAHTVAAKKEDVAKAIVSGRVLLTDGTNYIVPDTVAINGTSVVVGETTYTQS